MWRGEGRRRPLPWKVIAPIVAGAIVLAIAGIVGLRLRSLAMETSAEASLGRDQLVAGARILKEGGVGLTDAQAAQATVQFQSAESHFIHVRTVLTESRWFQMAGRLPWAGTQVRAGQDLSEMGIHLAKTGRLLADLSSSAFKAEPAGSGRSPGEKVLDLLHVLDPKVGAVSAELDTVLAVRHRLPSSGLIPQLSRAITELDKKVDLQQVKASLAKLRADEPGVRALLGADGPRTYLVLNQDPAELRATGGFIGTVGFLSFDHGKMAPFNPVNIDSIDKLPDGVTDVLGGPGTPSHVEPPAPMESVFHLRSWELRDSNWSPDFPTAAKQAEFLLNRERHKEVDGVIALDPFLIERLLALIGPVRVQATGDVVDQNNFYAVTLNRRELTGGGQRNTFIPAASKQIVTAVLSLPPAKWPALLAALQSGCDGRSLQAYFHDSSLQALTDRQHCGGQVQPSVHDSLMVVESNVGGNKDDFWMKRQYSLKIAVGADGTTHHTLRLHYDGLSDHGVALTRYWGYTGWLRVYLPPATTIGTIEGATLTRTTELDHTVLQGWFYLQFDHMTDIIIRYDEPAAISGATQGHLLFWQKQGGRQKDPISVELVPPAGSRLRAATVGTDPGPHSPVNSDLAVDRAFTFEYAKG
jgi:hypothetical protein